MQSQHLDADGGYDSTIPDPVELAALPAAVHLLCYKVFQCSLALNTSAQLFLPRPQPQPPPTDPYHQEITGSSAGS